MEDPEEFYDVEDGYDEDDRADEQGNKKVVYPPRLMVDFTSLGMNALLRYAQFYQIPVRDDIDKDELAAVVARHFDCTLEVEEDESLVSFMQRVRNGEKAVVRHRPPEKDRKAAKQQQQRKKSNSNSRKRQREASVTAAAGAGGSSGGGAKDAANGAGRGDAKSGHSGQRGGGGSGGSGGGAHADADDDAPVAARPTARSKPSGPSSSSSSGGSTSEKSGPNKSGSSNGKKAEKSKKEDNGEDNELYCICNLPSYGNMIACDGKKCPNPSQWYHLECVGFSDGRHPDTWLCPECDPKGFAEFKNKKKKNGNKQRSKSPGSK